MPSKSKIQKFERATERRAEDAERFVGVEVLSFSREWGNGEWVATGEFRRAGSEEILRYRIANINRDRPTAAERDRDMRLTLLNNMRVHLAEYEGEGNAEMVAIMSDRIAAAEAEMAVLFPPLGYGV